MPDIASSLELQWDFEELSGDAIDRTGHGHPGTFNGGTTRAAGIVGNKAVQFNGTDSYVSGTVSAISGRANASFYLRVYRPAVGSIQSGGFETANHYWNFIWFSDNVIYLRRNADGTGTSSVVLTTGNVGILVAYDGSSPAEKDRLYVNGSKQTLSGDANSNAVLPANAGNAFWVGRSNANGYSSNNSKVDEVRVWLRTLSDADAAMMETYIPTSEGLTSSALNAVRLPSIYE